MTATIAPRFVVDLKTPIPADLAGEFLSKLHYVAESLAGFTLEEPGRTQVRFDLRRGHESDESMVAARIVEVGEKVCKSRRHDQSKVLVDRMDVSVPFDEDPHPRLEASGDLYRYGTGRFGLGPRLQDLVTFFDRELTDYARGFGAKGYQFPTLIGADTLDRCRYLASFPQSLSLVSHLREDLGAIQNFAKTAHWNGEKLTVDRNQLADVETLLSSAVCYHYYAWLHDSKMDAPTITASVGKCFRYESGNLGGLERLWDFTMRELILVGPREFVLSQRQRAIGEVTQMLDRWGFAYEIRSATDPFFVDDFATQSTFQLAFDLKFEVRTRLPYKNSTLAAGSFNHHQDFFGRSFNITAHDGQPAHTGCIAFGLERLALAFVAQYGFDLAKWPATVASAMSAW